MGLHLRSTLVAALVFLSACGDDGATDTTGGDGEAVGATTGASVTTSHAGATTSAGSGTGGDATVGTGGGEGGRGGEGGECDPSVRTFEMPELVAPAAHVEIDPMVVDEDSFAYPQSKHQLFLPDPSVPRREELFVILPGTNNLAQGFETLGTLAAALGYPTIALAYESETHAIGLCSDVLDPDDHAACREAVWMEKAYGVDATDQYPGDEPNSVEGRLVRLLAFVDAAYPNAGADAYFDGSGVRWDRVALAGFSQGSVLAGYIGKDQELARLVLLAGGCDALGESGTDDREMLPWCFEARATPTERTWAFSHVDDHTNGDVLAHEAFGLFELGGYANASTESPTYCTGTHAIQSHEPTGKPHLSVALDGDIPLDDDGIPVLVEDYVYAFTAE